MLVTLLHTHICACAFEIINTTTPTIPYYTINPSYCWMPDLENQEWWVKKLFDGSQLSPPIPSIYTSLANLLLSSKEGCRSPFITHLTVFELQTFKNIFMYSLGSSLKPIIPSKSTPPPINLYHLQPSLTLTYYRSLPTLLNTKLGRLVLLSL